jgi:hypothetical protein
LLLVIIVTTRAKAQKSIPLTENIAVVENGLTYSYVINNEQNKSVKGEDYDRFEITVMIINNSGCNKVFPFKLNEKGELDTEANKLANFTITNATGKRLTSKAAKVDAKKIMQTVKVENIIIPNNPSGIMQATIGYGIKNNETIKRNIIVIVAKGQRPNVICDALHIPDVL